MPASHLEVGWQHHPSTLVKSSSSAWEEDSLVLTPSKESPWAVGLGMVSGQHGCKITEGVKQQLLQVPTQLRGLSPAVTAAWARPVPQVELAQQGRMDRELMDA